MMSVLFCGGGYFSLARQFYFVADNTGAITSLSDLKVYF